MSAYYKPSVRITGTITTSQHGTGEETLVTEDGRSWVRSDSPPGTGETSGVHSVTGERYKTRTDL